VATSLNGQTSKMKLLLSIGANANEPACEAAPCVRPLIAAALCGCPDAVQLLLDNGAKVDGKSSRGQTALTVAAYEGHTPTVGLLLSRGADPNIEWEGLTALDWAKRQHHQEAVDLLEKVTAAREQFELSKERVIFRVSVKIS